MGTQVATAVQQGAQNFRCVRVTDSTDTAAYTAVPGSNASFTALYTGSLGNNIALTLGTGSQPNSWKLSVLSSRFRARSLRRPCWQWRALLDGSGLRR